MVETSERLISRFGPVLAAGLEPSTPDSPGAADGPGAPAVSADPADPLVVHAEMLHQLCTADGLMELLDWSRQGLGADPLACMWLGSLRWYRLITGACPDSAPQPPTRALDHRLQLLRSSGRLTPLDGSATTSLRGLAEGQMAYPTAPAQPESTDAAALLRAVPVGLVPYIDAPMRRAWARQTMALTHGHPDLMQKAEELADLVHLLASGAPAEALDEIAARQRERIIADIDADVAAIVDRQLLAAATAVAAPTCSDAGAESHTVCDVIEDLARDWEEVTRAR